MFKRKICYLLISFFFIMALLTNSFALKLSLNKNTFIKGDNLELSIDDGWYGTADFYFGLEFPDGSFYFITPYGFSTSINPLISCGYFDQITNPFVNIKLPEISYGEYTFYAGVFKCGDVSQLLSNIASATFTFSNKEPEPLQFKSENFPDGIVGKLYNFVPETENGVSPYKIKIISGELPQGLKIDDNSGTITGIPENRGVWDITLQITDSEGNTGEFKGTIKIFGVITIGEHGKFNNCSGIQMAFNSAQDMDEIRIEKGTYQCTGLKIASKNWKNGIKISGGWDENFQKQDNDSSKTVFMGEENSDERILNIESGPASIENMTFKDGSHGAVYSSVTTTFTNCKFESNYRNGGSGGAVYIYGDGSFINCSFANNSVTSMYSDSAGGAVYIRGDGSFINCSFTGNSAATPNPREYLDQSSGGAVYIYGDGSFINCSFASNSATSKNGVCEGGAVLARGHSTFINCSFANNSTKFGGAVYSFMSSTFTNCFFTDNSVDVSGGAIYSSYSSTFTNCSFKNNSAQYGGAIYGESANTIINSLFYNNSANSYGGALYCYATILNSTFAKNSVTDNKEKGGAAYIKGTIWNSIFYKNYSGGEENDITPTGDLTIDYSLANNITGVFDYKTHNITGDPKFVDIDNGDLHLKSDSPAIDKGDSRVIQCKSYYNWYNDGKCDSSCANTCEDKWSDDCIKECCECYTYYYNFSRDENGNALDIDGNPRIKGSNIDMGAYEYQNY